MMDILYRSCVGNSESLDTDWLQSILKLLLRLCNKGVPTDGLGQSMACGPVEAGWDSSCGQTSLCFSLN